eukprot:852786-Karenia_brevis.AAC.1
MYNEALPEWRTILDKGSQAWFDIKLELIRKLCRDANLYWERSAEVGHNSDVRNVRQRMQSNSGRGKK